MNFYTLTFKNKILLSFLLIFLSLIVLDISLYFIAKSKTTKISFINNKFSKTRHFQLNKTDNKDIIFIGSSKTYYHISTNIFKKNRINIYNFGIEGAKYEDFPSLLKYIKSKKPKKIIISLSVDKLFSKLNISKFPTLEEIKYYYDIDKIKFLKSLKQWIINRHLFLQYSEPIFYNLKSIYKMFEGNNKINISYNSNYKKIKNKKILFNDKDKNYSKLVGCDDFDIKKNSNTKIVLKCTNGDGILIGNSIENIKIKKTELKNLDLQAIKYFQKIINSIDRKKVNVSIILEPILHNNYTYNLVDIKKQFLNLNIIDLTNLNIKDSFWADNNHFNYKGRDQYSEYLSRIFK